MATDFKTLLFRAGFMNFGKLDRKQACTFLHVTERTLDRWIMNNKPCPRAVDLLTARIEGTVSTKEQWKDFRFVVMAIYGHQGVIDMIQTI